MNNSEKTQDNGWHTIEQIKAMGNKIFTTKGEEGLTTKRGNTVTYWMQDGDKYYPYDCKTL